ncbi:MAG: sigma-54 dependent transcriptional regulator [Chitinophagaceae bacterium]
MTTGKILIIDEEEKLRNLISRIVRLEGNIVLEASGLKSAMKVIEKEEPDVLLCDVRLPDGSGVDFTKEVKTKYPLIEVILLTAFGNITDGVQAMKNGAFDYITKGNDNARVVPLLNKALEKVALQRKLLHLEKQVGKRYSFDSIIGTSTQIEKAKVLAEKVACTDSTVLLLGETGTGKEVFAQAIHNASTRSKKLFMALNCSSFSNELLESEVFGHKAGAFTGAIKDKKGLIEEASGGTLFLDEIGEMPIELQSKLLRVLETSEFIKVGDTKSTRVDVRIIAATNRDLAKESKEGNFREDLFYRLNVFAINMPALRDRKEDIPQFAKSFLLTYAQNMGKRIPGIHADYMKHLMQHYWRGNIRELKNIIERSVILTDGNELLTETLPVELVTSSAGETVSSFNLCSMEQLHIQKVLQHTKGNKTKAADLLGIAITTLSRKMDEYQISIQ